MYLLILAGLSVFFAFFMGLWADLNRVTLEDGPFAGYSETRMMVLLQELTSHDNMRFDNLGRPVSEAQQGMLERSFRDHFHLSAEQWSCITNIHDRSDLTDISSARVASLPTPMPGQRPTYVRRIFAAQRVRCCGRVLRVRWVSATVYCRDECYASWNLVKSCRQCRARYMFDKKVLSGQYGGEQADWHIYKSWDDGELPGYVGSKSGHAIFCTRYLTAVTVDQRTMG